MEDRESYGNEGALLPIVCRVCGDVQRVPLTLIHTEQPVSCGSCGRNLEVGQIAAALPKTVRLETPFSLARPVSEFP